MYDLIDTLDQVPINQLLNVASMKASNAQKDVILTALYAIHAYGCEKLFHELAIYAHKFFVLGSMISVHLDLTSIVLYHYVWF